MKTLQITPCGQDPVIAFAAKELCRYLARGLGAKAQVRIVKTPAPAAMVIRLGVLADMPETGRRTKRFTPAHDAVLIRTGSAGGYVAGSNPRSVLLGVYRYLTELGCRWVRPGKDGELIPALKLPLSPVTVAERAAYDHRGVCIEGAVSFEHVRDMVAWLPKLGFNAYFIQFREAYNFFQRWYEHVGNPRLTKRTFSLDAARLLTQKLRGEIKRRGLDLHMVGHGWTCEPFGIPGLGWFVHEGPIPATATRFLAEVKGKRELWGGIALNTNLCYGNPEVRTIVTAAIVEYAAANPDVDIIHFWLADGSNNQCECPLCREHLPADLYVTMLNDLDCKLTARGLRTRIVFLIYVDLLWPPAVETIANPERFILMFAPITRSYSTPFAAGAGRGALPAIPPFRRNQLEFPKAPQANLAFLRGWDQAFSGDSFDFDYHFMWDHYKDPGQYAMAQVLHQDIQRLMTLGLNGFVSCQVQRAFFPTGLGMTVMGRTLWDRNLGFDEIAADYFGAAFGRDGPRVRRYLERISTAFNPKLLRGETSAAEIAAAPARLADVSTAGAELRPILARGERHRDPCRARSWQVLAAHAEYCQLLSRALAERAAGRPAEAREAAAALFDWLRRHERRLHPVLDVFECLRVLAPFFGLLAQ